jgi:hypothetical protein
MTSSVNQLLEKFRVKGALVDTNLLLLYLIGSYDPDLVIHRRFKRVAKYTAEDFDALILLLNEFRASVTTPHVLTEVSNLAGQLSGRFKEECFKKFVELFTSFTELGKSSLLVASRQQFPYLGLTDCAIIDAASEYLVITDDLKLYTELGYAGLEALNFNHVRTLAWRNP